MNLVLVDGDDEHRVFRAEQFLRDRKAALHHRQPLAVAVGVLQVDVIVVVLPVPSAGVVGRIDVDAVDLAATSKGKCFEDVKVLAVDNYVVGLIAASSYSTDRAQSRVNGVPELRNDHQLRYGLPRYVDLAAFRPADEDSLSSVAFLLEAADDPRSLINRGRCAARRSNPNLVAATDLATVQLDRLRHVPLKVEAERAAGGEN